MRDTEKKSSDKQELDDCMKPNNPEAQRADDKDDACHEAVDGN